MNEGRGSLGLKAEHARTTRRQSRGLGLDESLPVRGDVAGVADRDAERIRRVAERVADLERGGLLSLDAVGIDAVDERRLTRLAELADHGERRVERAAHRD